MRLLCGFSLMLAILGSALAGGYVVSVETKDYKKEPPATSANQLLIKGNKIKFVDGKAEKEGSNYMVFDGDSKSMIMVNTAKKAYVKIDRDVMQRVSKQMDEQIKLARSQMESRLAQVPEAQRDQMRAMMEKQFKQFDQPSPAKKSSEVKQTKQKKKIGDYPCELYEHWEGGHKRSEIWVTAFERVGIKDQAFNAFKAMGTIFEEMTQGAGNNPFTQSMQSPFEPFKEIEGFPVLIRRFGDGGKLVEETSFKSLESKDLDDTIYLPPKGFLNQNPFGQ